MKGLYYTVFALLAFAGNSVLCRLALGESLIDAGSFTIVRLFSGMIALLIIFCLFEFNGINKRKNKTNGFTFNSFKINILGVFREVDFQLYGSWLAALYLFIYAITFSYAYISLDTGVGALILFGAVQITMISYGVAKGNKLGIWELIGVLMACTGLIYLLLPDLTMPNLFGFFLMALSGIAWGFYTLAGLSSRLGSRLSSRQPLNNTAFNFLRTLPFLIILFLLNYPFVYMTYKGFGLAVMSGVLMSGVGYAIWYAALRYLTSIKASLLQLLVPIIAAIGGVIFSAEVISKHLIISSLLTLGGVLLVFLAKNKVIKQ